MITQPIRRAIAALLLVSIVSCDAPTLLRPDAGYDPTTLTNGLLYRWSSGKTVRVWVVRDGTASDDLSVAVRQAIARWNGVRQFAEFTLVAATSIQEAEVVVYDRVSAMPVQAGACTFDPRNSAGYTYFCPVAIASGSTAARLDLSSGVTSNVSVVIRVDRGRVDSQRAYSAVVAHEFGHALGIGAHSDLATDLMFGLPAVEEPSARDVATLRYLLGQRPALTL